MLHLWILFLFSHTLLLISMLALGKCAISLWMISIFSRIFICISTVLALFSCIPSISTLCAVRFAFSLSMWISSCRARRMILLSLVTMFLVLLIYAIGCLISAVSLVSCLRIWCHVHVLLGIEVHSYLKSDSLLLSAIFIWFKSNSKSHFLISLLHHYQVILSCFSHLFYWNVNLSIVDWKIFFEYLIIEFIII